MFDCVTVYSSVTVCHIVCDSACGYNVPPAMANRWSPMPWLIGLILDGAVNSGNKIIKFARNKHLTEH